MKTLFLIGGIRLSVLILFCYFPTDVPASETSAEEGDDLACLKNYDSYETAAVRVDDCTTALFNFTTVAVEEKTLFRNGSGAQHPEGALPTPFYFFFQSCALLLNVTEPADGANITDLQLQAMTSRLRRCPITPYGLGLIENVTLLGFEPTELALKSAQAGATVWPARFYGLQPKEMKTSINRSSSRSQAAFNQDPVGSKPYGPWFPSKGEDFREAEEDGTPIVTVKALDQSTEAT